MKKIILAAALLGMACSVAVAAETSPPGTGKSGRILDVAAGKLKFSKAYVRDSNTGYTLTASTFVALSDLSHTAKCASTVSKCVLKVEGTVQVIANGAIGVCVSVDGVRGDCPYAVGTETYFQVIPFADYVSVTPGTVHTILIEAYSNGAASATFRQKASTTVLYK